MTRHHRYFVRLCFLAFCFVIFGMTFGTPKSSAEAPKPIRIGMAKSFFLDVPDAMVQMLSIPFRSLMKNQTGLDGRLETSMDCFELGEKLEKNEIQLGVFHGFEFAWVKEKYPKLRPLMIAINKDRELSANIVLREDKNFTSFADLKGKQISLPKRSRGHCRLFLERRIEECGSTPADFCKLCNHSNIETALDEVVLGNVECIVIDGVSLDCYRQIKPGCFKRLKIFKRSEIFPAAVVVYQPGNLRTSIINRFRNGMLNAHKNFRSRHLMTMWKLTAFEPIPNNYNAILTNIRKCYPSPNLESTSFAQTADSEIGEGAD